MMGWLIALLIFVLLAFLPLGVRGIYESVGLKADILIGPVSVALYPGKKKGKKEKQNKAKKPTEEKIATGKTEKKGGSYQDFLPLVRIATDFLGDLRRKLRVKRLEMLLCMAGDDPCDLAVNYGKAWAAVGNLMPQLERFFVIKKRDVQVCCDFTAVQTTLYLRADITITLGRLLGLLVRYGWRAYKEYSQIMDKRKGGALK